jgi:predicted Zn-dependent protease
VHIAERHGTRQATSGQAINYSGIPLIVTGWSGLCAEGLAVPRGFVTARRSYEREADALTIQIMARTGIDPHAMVRYTERVQPPPSSTPSPTLSTHLPRDERVAIMTSAISDLPAIQYGASADGDFVAAREEARRFVPPHSPTPPSLRRKTPE